ncbi:MAG: polysaccharide deacetylase family protein, partial [Anaerolineae bacterium]|nr:polysaccharide deacetylase family protein [Anaerolineae bacterium]
GFRRRKGRLVVIADDGAASFMNLGMQILNRYGIPATAAIISDRVGATSYFCTEAQLRNFVDAGNMCVAHGPLGGSGDLFTTHATDAAAIADMQATRDWLVSRQLTNSRGAQCYVWPQGEWTRVAGDPSFLDLAWNAGFRAARLADTTTSRYVSAVALIPGKHNFLLNTLGHRYAGAPNTPDDAAETANIDAVVARMQYVAAAGLDSFLVLHEIVGRGAASSTTQIETDRLQTLGAAAQTLMAADTLECITMDQML